MDIKTEIEKVVASVTKDAALKEAFAKDPVAAVKKVLGAALPADVSDEVVKKIVDGVKAKISADKLSDAAGALGKLFGK